MAVYKGVLIDQSVSNPDAILKLSKVISSRDTTLEGESFRGKVTFHNLEVAEDNLWPVLEQVAATIKSRGWYFHLVDDERLYIVMPRAILFASNNDDELQAIIDYTTGQGIHPEQLNLKQLFADPYA